MTFKQEYNLDFDAIRLKIASPAVIKAWSHGEVTKPETINYRTQKPEKDGLFCEKIFGPSKDWECYCGKYKKIRYKGIVCDKCGVEVTHSSVRRERMGHIELAVPVAHIWFLRGVPSKIGLALGVSVQNLEKVIYFANYIVTDVNTQLRDEMVEELKKEYKGKLKALESELGARTGDDATAASKAFDVASVDLKEDFDSAIKDLRDLEVMRILTEHQYHELSLRYGHIFDAGIGAEAVHDLLAKLDLDKEIAAIEQELESAADGKKLRLIRRAKLLKSFRFNGMRPEWMVITMLPVIPPDLRPMVALDGGRFATSDLNDLYRRVINRNNRLKRLVELNAPEVIRRNEKRMLQEACDALIDNSARQTKNAASSGQKRQLKSIADLLKGKQGRFRQNLLGKRTDYSGRSVIVVGPNLRLDQCGIPKIMALELFKPFVMSRLIRDGIVHNVRAANRFIESGKSEVWDILEEVTSVSHVLLNRAPTLHRLGIQAFRPILVEGKAIQVHPMVCKAFNADFDGDTMSVHVPLTKAARWEAEHLMLSTKNLLKPANGQPIMTPDKDVAWGAFYLTTFIEPKNGTTRAFSDGKEAVLAYEMGKLNIRERIRVFMDARVGTPSLIETSVGRILLNRVIPEGLPFYNTVMETKKLGEVVRLCLDVHGQEKTAQFLDALKNLGYHYITKSGFSFSMNDLPAMPAKSEIMKDAREQEALVRDQYEEGLLTDNERYQKVVAVWEETRGKVEKAAKATFKDIGHNSIMTMIESGARGSWKQLNQMMGMKGLVTNPAGEIIELPITASFREGFDVLEYFISTHGLRKGLTDTALKTAAAGYLTRRLVDVAQDVVVRAEDCGDTEGVVIDRARSEEIGDTLANRIIGRVALEAVNQGSSTVLNAGDMITEEHVKVLEEMKVPAVRVRSVLRCKLPRGVCQKCYGHDLSTGKLVALGTAVGIVAAQSIGEPGTQLTMRTFHTGGVAGSDITQGLPRVEEIFEAREPKKKAVMTDVAGTVSIEHDPKAVVVSGKRTLAPVPGQKVVRISYDETVEKRLVIGSKDLIRVKDGQAIDEGNVLLERVSGDIITSPASGIVEIAGNTLFVRSKGKGAREFVIPPGYSIWVKDGQRVEIGAQLTDGHLDPEELYRVRGREAVEDYILQEVQSIYALQGSRLNDKHIDIITRQMFSRVEIDEAGETTLLPGEVVDKTTLHYENEVVSENKNETASGREMLLGITRVSLSTESFLSSASFQETAKVLIGAAVTGKIDRLEGLKENVIIGRLVPAGTGFVQGMVSDSE